MKNSDQRILKELINGCVRGERACQQEVFKILYGTMMSICTRYISDKDIAKDVLQDAFIKVFTSISKYVDSGPFEGWVRTIVVNTALDHLRRNRLILNAEPLAQINIAEETSEDDPAYLSELGHDEIIGAINKLTPAYRTVFNLFVIEGYNHLQISEMLGISVGASKSNLFKAKQNLQKILIKKVYQYN